MMNRVLSKVYILQLHQQKWYVGTTKNIETRINQHIRGRGSAWTQIYRPINIHHVVDGGNPIEMWYTLKFMDIYGIENVRGGPWVKPRLSKPTKKEIDRILMFFGNKCFKCGEKGHFSAQCKK